MFAMFGASVLVPFMFGINPAIVITDERCGNSSVHSDHQGQSTGLSGIQFCIPVTRTSGMPKFGYQYALGGFVVLGIAGMIVALIIRQCGTNWIDIVLPTAAMGPVVALIGLELAGSAASTAGLLDDTDRYEKCDRISGHSWRCCVWSDPFPGFLSVIPILIAIIAGYVAAALCGILDFTAVKEAAFFALPNFQHRNLTWMQY